MNHLKIHVVIFILLETTRKFSHRMMAEVTSWQYCASTTQGRAEHFLYHAPLLCLSFRTNTALYLETDRKEKADIYLILSTARRVAGKTKYYYPNAQSKMFFCTGIESNVISLLLIIILRWQSHDHYNQISLRNYPTALHRQLKGMSPTEQVRKYSRFWKCMTINFITFIVPYIQEYYSYT
jgi:hypothetical protein